MDVLQSLRSATAAWCWGACLWPQLIHTEGSSGSADHGSVELSTELWPLGPPRVPKGFTDQAWVPLPWRKLLTVEWPKQGRFEEIASSCLARFYCFCSKTQKYSVIYGKPNGRAAERLNEASLGPPTVLGIPPRSPPVINSVGILSHPLYVSICLYFMINLFMSSSSSWTPKFCLWLSYSCVIRVSLGR